MSGRRNKGGGGGHGGGGEERWLLPYADMITLLLGLFIVLFAMSSINAKQFDNVKRSLAQTFKGAVLEEPGGVMPGTNGALDVPNASTAAPATTALQINEAAQHTAAKFQQQEKQLEGLVKQSGLGNDVKVVTNERGIQINLAGDALFESGQWTIKPAFREKLVRIERQLQAFGHPIEITGHTDGQRWQGGSNKMLGAYRALAVYDLFLEKGYADDKMKVVTWGEAKPVKSPQNASTPNPWNRRIEITVLQPGADVAMTDVQRAAALAENAKDAPGAKAPAPKPVQPELAREFSETSLISELAATTRTSG